MQTINILVKNIYGNQNAYPNCDNAKLFAQLTGKKTFSTTDLQVMQKLGYKVQFSNQANSFEQSLGA